MCENRGPKQSRRYQARSGTAVTDDNILRKEPRRAARAYAKRSTGSGARGPGHQHVIIRLPDGARAEVTHVRLRAKKGKSVRWFWTPDSAQIVEE